MTLEATLESWRTELALRESNGVSVALYWSRETDILTVVVADAKTGDDFELVLGDGDRPLDVFYHPFAYARARGIELREDVREALPELVFDA